MVVRISSMALRIAVLVELVLGVSLWIGRPLAPVLLHMALGLLIVALVWFLGLAQATVKDGSLGLTLATFGVGLTLAILGPRAEGCSRPDRAPDRPCPAGAGDHYRG